MSCFGCGKECERMYCSTECEIEHNLRKVSDEFAEARKHLESLHHYLFQAWGAFDRYKKKEKGGK